jgi:streptogramin lyase
MSHRNVSRLLFGVLSALAACAPTGEAGLDDSANIGTAIAEIRLAPPDVKCVVITVTRPNGAGMRFTYAMSGAANTSFFMTGLYIDNDTFQATAFNVPCAQSLTATATWVHANPVTVAVTHDPPVSVVLTMKTNGGTNGKAAVNAEFPDPRGIITEFTLPTANSGPMGITSGPDGNLWFTEGTRAAIGSITPSGVITETVVSGKPNQIITGADGNLWFTDDLVNFGIGKMSPNRILRTFPQGIRTGGIAVGGDGNVWFTSASSAAILSITPTGTVRSFPAPGTNQGLAAGSDGRLWFTDGSSRIGAMTLAGVVTEYLVPSGGGWPGSIVAGPDDNLWFTLDAASKVGRMTTAGVGTEFTVPGSKGASRIAVGPDGNLWFAENNPAAIARITPTGTITEFRIPNSTCVPTSITAGPDNNVWFTESSCNKIGRITPP